MDPGGKASHTYRTLKLRHLETLISAHRIGRVLKYYCKFGDAERWHRKTLEGRMKVLADSIFEPSKSHAIYIPKRQPLKKPKTNTKLRLLLLAAYSLTSGVDVPLSTLNRLSSSTVVPSALAITTQRILFATFSSFLYAFSIFLSALP